MLPPNPAGRYLNLSISLKNKGSSLDIDRVKAGKLTIPGIWINPFIRAMNHFLLYSEMIKSFYRYAHAVNDISIANGHLTFVYEWNPAALGLMHGKGKQFLLSRDHQEKLVQYYNMLVQTLKPYKNNKVSIFCFCRACRLCRK